MDARIKEALTDQAEFAIEEIKIIVKGIPLEILKSVLTYREKDLATIEANEKIEESEHAELIARLKAGRDIVGKIVDIWELL